MSVCLSAQKNSTPLNEFSRNLVFEYFSKICHGISSFFKFGKNNEYFTQRPKYIYDISLNSL